MAQERPTQTTPIFPSENSPTVAVSAAMRPTPHGQCGSNKLIPAIITLLERSALNAICRINPMTSHENERDPPQSAPQFDRRIGGAAYFQSSPLHQSRRPKVPGFSPSP